MEISKKIDAAIKAKTTKLKELIEAYKVDTSNSKRDRTARVKTSIPPKEGDNLQNFHEIQNLFQKLIDAVKQENSEDAKLGFVLIAKYEKLDKLLDKIYSQNILQFRSRASVDWFLFPKRTRYYKSNVVLPKHNLARINLVEKITATENDDEIVTNDFMFPTRNVSTANQNDDTTRNEKAKCNLDVTIVFKPFYKPTMPEVTLLRLAHRCYKHSCTLVHVDCKSTSQVARIYAAGRVYFNMEYYIQESNGNARLNSYLTLVEEYHGDANILLHHFVSRIVKLMSRSPPQRDLPRFIFFANPSNRMLSLYPCDLKLEFDNVTYCGLSLQDIKSITTYDKPVFKKYTRDGKAHNIDLFLVEKNEFKIDFSTIRRDADNKICSVAYSVKGFADVTVQADSQEDLCKQLDVFTTIDGSLLKDKLELYDSTSGSQSGIKKFSVNVDGHDDNNTCVYNALKCAINALKKAKVKDLPMPSSSMAYTSSSKGLADITAFKICKQIGFKIQYVLNSDSNQQRLKAVLERSADVANKMLLISLEIAGASHSHCICVDLRSADPKIWINCETNIELTQQNLNKQCRDGLYVSGICFILSIHENLKQKRAHKFKKSNKMSKAK